MSSEDNLLDARTAAELAQLAYRPNRKADEHPLYQLDYSLSNRDHKVWTMRPLADKPPGPKLVIGYKGTTGLSDWPNNLLSTVGMAPLTARHKKAEQVFARALEKHHMSLAEAATVGHSAGGLVASHLNSRFNVQSHAFNPHIPLVATENYAKPTNHIYISGKDPVSIMARMFPKSRVTYVKAKGRDHHALRNFL